jgi:hypothetical protein
MFPLHGPEYDLPPPDPDSPPDSRDLGGPCPRCGRTSTFELIGRLPLTFDRTLQGVGPGGGGIDFEASERVTVLECRGCHQNTAVVEQRWIGTELALTGMGHGGTVNYRGAFWYPPASVASLDQAIPEPIREAFVEGAKCLAVLAPRAAAVMFRRSLEAVVRDRGSAAAVTATEGPRGALYAALKVMADEHTLDPSLASWAKEIRLAGNAGGHFDPLDDVTMDEAKETSKLVRNVFTFLYEAPARLKRQRT